MVYKSKYIQHNLAEEIFASLQLVPLVGYKWIWKSTDNLYEDAKNIETC